MADTLADKIRDVIIGLGHDEFGDIRCPDCASLLYAHIEMVRYTVQIYRDINAETNVAFDEIAYSVDRYDDSESDIIYTSVGCPRCGWKAVDHVH